jgi:hypothetical protein
MGDVSCALNKDDENLNALHDDSIHGIGDRFRS